MTREGRDRALLVLEGMRPWRMECILNPNAVVLARNLPKREFPREIRALRGQLRAMVKEDQSARLAFDEARAEAADARNRTEVLRIFERYGWVTYSLAGKDAAHDFWLLVPIRRPRSSGNCFPPWKKRPWAAMHP